MLPRATPAQVKYIESLRLDIGLNTPQRNSLLSTLCDRPITFVDDLYKHEASKCIDYLKAIYEGKYPKREVDDRDELDTEIY
jgi:hypothetical protein